MMVMDKDHKLDPPEVQKEMRDRGPFSPSHLLRTCYPFILGDSSYQKEMNVAATVHSTGASHVTIERE